MAKIRDGETATPCPAEKTLERFLLQGEGYRLVERYGNVLVVDWLGQEHYLGTELSQHFLDKYARHEKEKASVQGNHDSDDKPVASVKARRVPSRGKTRRRQGCAKGAAAKRS